MKLIVSRGAAADLERLHAFLADKDPKAAQRAVGVLVRVIDSLAQFPDRGSTSAVAGARELIVPFGRSAYVVRFVHNARRGEIVILRIWHGREARESPERADLRRP